MPCLRCNTQHCPHAIHSDRGVQAVSLLELLLVELVEHPSSREPLTFSLIECTERLGDLAVTDHSVLESTLTALLELHSRWAPARDEAPAAEETPSGRGKGAAAGKKGAGGARKRKRGQAAGDENAAAAHNADDAAQMGASSTPEVGKDAGEEAGSDTGAALWQVLALLFADADTPASIQALAALAALATCDGSCGRAGGDDSLQAALACLLYTSPSPRD